MALGIVLTLDDELAAPVEDIWRRLEAAGVGKTPGQFAEPPHVTLALLPYGDPAQLADLLDTTPFAGTSVKLVPFGAFRDERCSLYYNAVLCPALLGAHAALYDQIRALRLEHDELYAPGSAVFHCSLAVDIEPESLPAGVDICLRGPRELRGHADAVELFEYFPARSLHRRRLEQTDGTVAP